MRFWKGQSRIHDYLVLRRINKVRGPMLNQGRGAPSPPPHSGRLKLFASKILAAILQSLLLKMHMNFISIQSLFYSLSSLLCLQFPSFVPCIFFLSLFLLQVMTWFFVALASNLRSGTAGLILSPILNPTEFNSNLITIYEKRISQLLEKLCNKLLQKIFKITPIWFLQLQLFKTGKKVENFKDKMMKCSFFLETFSFQISYRFEKKTN